MNKSISIQPVGGIVLSGILTRLFPAFLTVWGGQTEREPPFAISNSMQSVSGSASVWRHWSGCCPA